MEAVKAALASLPQDSVVLRYLLAAANDITSSDVDLAAASGAIVLGFNVEPAEAVLADAKNRGARRTSRPPNPTRLGMLVSALHRRRNRPLIYFKELRNMHVQLQISQEAPTTAMRMLTATVDSILTKFSCRADQ